MSVQPLVVRQTWDRSDKVGWFFSIIFFWGLPCIVALPILAVERVWWAAVLVSVLLVAVGTYFWRYHARAGGKLLAEVTADGIRFRDDEQPVPWTEVAWVDARHTASGTYGPPSHDYVVLHLKDGQHIEHQVDSLYGQVATAIIQLAPQVPRSAPA